MPETLEHFADECSLLLTAEPLCVAPRDLLTPLEDLDQHYLVSLTRPGTKEPPVRLVFLSPVTSGRTPLMGDVLWWLAGDAWVLERANREFAQWAATYGYSSTDERAAWLFEQTSRQTAGLERLLGPADMRRLMTLYEVAIDPPQPR